MATPRAGHAATLLADGRVLVTGGVNSFGLPEALPTAEVYEPKTGTWSSASPMHTGRHGHVAVRLVDGRVLIAGGATRVDTHTNGGLGEAIKTVELYNPATNSWSWAASLNAVAGARTATLLPNGKVLVIGFRVAEIYDPATDTWSPTAPMPATNPGGTATLLRNGKVLAAPGYTPDGLTAAATGLYDPDSNSWSPAAPMGWSRTSVTAATRLGDGSVLVVGISAAGIGVSTAAVYNPGSNSWTSVADNVPGLGRVNFLSLVTLPSGKALAFSGGTSPEGPIQARLYDPIAGSWSTLPETIFPRAAGGFTTSVLADGRVLLVGGWLMNRESLITGQLAGAEIYSP